MEEKLRQVFCDILRANPVELRDDTTPDELPQWDSLQHLNLVITLEETFDVSFTPEEINEMRISFGTVKHIVLTKSAE